MLSDPCTVYLIVSVLITVWLFPSMNTTGITSSCPSSVYDESGTSIYYARWNGKQWLFNVPIIGGLNGLPTQISAVLDTNGRVFLTWVDANNGNLLFSWAYVNRANVTLT